MEAQKQLQQDREMKKMGDINMKEILKGHDNGLQQGIGKFALALRQVTAQLGDDTKHQHEL